jgi:hypothetical protein
MRLLSPMLVLLLSLVVSAPVIALVVYAVGFLLPDLLVLPGLP